MGNKPEQWINLDVVFLYKTARDDLEMLSSKNVFYVKESSVVLSMS